MTRKREGFKDQQAIVLPIFVQKELNANLLTKQLYLTDIGKYPNAQYHYRERNQGSEQHILVHCTAGNGWLEIDGVRNKVEENQYFIIPAATPHRYGASITNPWSILWMHFTGELSQLFVDENISVKQINNPDQSKYNDRLHLFDDIYRSLSMGYSKENLEYSSISLWYLLGSFTYSTQFQRVRELQKYDIIEKSIAYMQQRINNAVTLYELAEHCGFSASHYSMVFKKKTSRSPIEYFIELKMQKACQLLDFTYLRIQEIASELSFQDQFYFSRQFRKSMGISPSEYRKKKKG